MADLTGKVAIVPGASKGLGVAIGAGTCGGHRCSQLCHGREGAERKLQDDTRGKRNFTEPHLGGKSPWTGVDSNTEANVFSTVIERPTTELSPKPEIHIWGRCSVRRDGKLLHVDRAGHPSVSSFFNTDDTKEDYNASEPVNDRRRWLEQFVHLMGHTGNYTREEAIAAIDRERTLPDVLSFDPSKRAVYPNGRSFTDDVINYRLAFLTNNQCPPTGLKPHTDILKEFPYIGTPHPKK